MDAAMPEGLQYLHESAAKIESFEGRVLLSEVADRDRWLRGRFADYASWPKSAKLATLDMLYNLGPTRFLHYTELNKALAAGDWTAAGKQSGRNINDAGFAERNYWTLCQFLDAGKDITNTTAA